MKRLILLVLLVTACDDPLARETLVELSVASLEVDDCGNLDRLRLDLDTDGVDDCGALLFIRLQEGGRPIHESDGVVIEVGELSDLKDTIEAEGVAEITLPDPRIRCSLYLHARCPDSYQPLICGAGLIRWTRLKPGTRLSFELDAEVLDMRSNEVVGAGLHMDADFPVSNGSPLLPFSGCPED